MNIQQEVKQLAILDCKKITGLPLPPGVNDDEIRAFERRTGLVIPNALCEWLKFTNAPIIGYGIVNGIVPGNPNRNIESSYPDYLEFWKDNGWIPIADDGCGNDYVVATKEDDGPGNPVFFFDIIHDETKPAYVVASDLWHFFWFYIRESLKEKEEGLPYNDEWPFNKEKVLAIDPDLQNYKKYPLPWEVA
jgi:hypothetical protein